MDLEGFYSKSRNEQIEIENAYGARKSGNTTEYNFNIYDMINDFSFYDLIYRTKATQCDYGAFLVITDKQYILGYNADYGRGSHQQALARCMAEIDGGKNISIYKDSVYYADKCIQTFLTARILYTYVGENENFQPTFNGNIIFLLDDKKITPEQMKCFEKFYEDYGNEIARTCNSYSMMVSFSYYDEEGNRKSNYSRNLDNIYEYLKTVVSDKIPKVSDEDEIIIGEQVKQNNFGK